MNKRLIVISLATSALLLASCGIQQRTENPRYVFKEMAFRPMCANFRAPNIGTLPPKGVVAAYLFTYDGDPVKRTSELDKAWTEQRLVYAPEGGPSINGTRLLVAFSADLIRSQEEADDAYKRLCAIDSEHVQLAHVRYNPVSQATRLT